MLLAAAVTSDSNGAQADNGRGDRRNPTRQQRQIASLELVADNDADLDANEMTRSTFDWIGKAAVTDLLISDDYVAKLCSILFIHSSFGQLFTDFSTIIIILSSVQVVQDTSFIGDPDRVLGSVSTQDT
jgi:hypothetical protein